MSIKRYAAHTNIDDFKSDWHESKDGPMVKYSDYSALEQQLAALTSQLESVVAENAALKAFGDKLNDMHNDLNGEGTGIQGRAEVACQQVALEAAMEEFGAIKTPATDAFLAEVRASGVEMAAKSEQFSTWVQQGLRSFAIGVRQGGAQ